MKPTNIPGISIARNSNGLYLQEADLTLTDLKISMQIMAPIQTEKWILDITALESPKGP